MKIINKKENDAITLVALVITIILLLILAGITISQLQNSGLFDKSKTAKEKYENAQEDENDKIAKYENEINSYINGNRDFSNINYSTEEQDTGLKWIDGKKIFQITITGNTLPANNTVLVSGVDALINQFGEQLYDEGSTNAEWYHFPYRLSDFEIRGVRRGEKILIRNLCNKTTKYHWTFQYTKVNE